MKFIVSLFLLFLIVVGISEPAFAMMDARDRPGYLKEYKYIKNNSCNAVSMIPYSGKVLYECASGESFWSEVLVPTEKSALFMYFKNRKHEDDESYSYY